MTDSRWGRIARPELAARLAAALERGSLVLVAGAGAGKTMALEEALAVRGGAAAWVRCTPPDRDPGRLVAHVVDAVRRAAPGAADVIAERLAAATERVDVELVVGALLSELRGLLVDPLTVVVDDAEHLAGAPAAAAVVGELLVADVPALRVAVLTRVALPCDLERARRDGRLAEPAEADLAFTPQECAALLATRLRRPVTDEERDRLWEATAGWPLGVALGGGAREQVAEYLEEELLDGLEPGLRAAVLDSAVAPDLEPGLVEALGLGADFVAAVRASGLPLRELESGGRAAFHPLVREVLVARFERERPAERRRELRARCAAALEAAGRGPEAVEQWLEAGTPEAAAAVARHGQGLVRSAPDTVARWLERLPAGAAAGDPALSLLEGRLAAGAARLEEAVGPLRAAVGGYAERGEAEAEWLARVALGDVLMLLQDFDETVALTEGFEDVAAVAAPIAGLSAAAAHSRAGRFADAAATLERVAGHPGAAVAAPLLGAFRGYYLDFPQGRLDAALEGVESGLAALERSDPFARLPYLLGLAAFVREERGEDEEAFALAERAERLTERTVLGGYIGDVARRGKAAALARAGRLAEAELELSRTRPELPHSYFGGDADVTRAIIAVRRGDHAAALAAAQQAIDHGGLDSWLARRRTTLSLAPLLVEAGRAAWAHQLVEAALGLRPDGAAVARLRVVRAWMREREGDTRGAVEDVVAAWEEAGDEAVHLVRREAGRIEALLWTALERGALEPGTVAATLEAARPGGGAVLPLTRHPLAGARRAALEALAGSGHPDVARVAAELEHDGDGGVAAAARLVRGRVARHRPPLAITLLGGFAVRRGAFLVPDDAWDRRASQRLVRYLLVHADAPVPEEHLFAAFWPGRSVAAARRSLHVAASSARGALDPPGAPGSILEVAGRAYRLVLGERDEVDARRFEQAARAALAAGDPGALEAAAALWGGEPLPEDRYEDWAAAPRERLLDLRTRLLAALAAARAEVGDLPGAIDAGRRLVETDPLDEEAHRGLMRAYARAGRRGNALRQYLTCRRALVDRLGVEPAPETTELQQRILAGDAV